MACFHVFSLTSKGFHAIFLCERHMIFNLLLTETLDFIGLIGFDKLKI
jgi:hypothetical protein